jgi:hypothetical protein
MRCLERVALILVTPRPRRAPPRPQPRHANPMPRPGRAPPRACPLPPRRARPRVHQPPPRARPPAAQEPSGSIPPLCPHARRTPTSVGRSHRLGRRRGAYADTRRESRRRALSLPRHTVSSFSPVPLTRLPTPATSPPLHRPHAATPPCSFSRNRSRLGR